jgi:hypothetical protein
MMSTLAAPSQLDAPSALLPAELPARGKPGANTVPAGSKARICSISARLLACRTWRVGPTLLAPPAQKCADDKAGDTCRRVVQNLLGVR